MNFQAEDGNGYEYEISIHFTLIKVHLELDWIYGTNKLLFLNWLDFINQISFKPWWGEVKLN